MRAAHVRFGARRQVHQRVRELADVDHHQRERVVGQGGERFLAEPGQPQEHELAGLDIDLAVELQQGDVGADALVLHQGDRAEAHSMS